MTLSLAQSGVPDAVRGAPGLCVGVVRVSDRRCSCVKRFNLAPCGSLAFPALCEELFDRWIGDVEGVSNTVEGVSNTVEGVSNTVEGVSNTVEGVSNTVEGVSNTVEGVSNTVEGCDCLIWP